MNIRNAHFHDTLIEKNCVGAGIIPIAIDHQRRIRILLGRERYVAYWKGSRRWSGFEGSPKKNESVIETAIRELNEESIGIVSILNDVLYKKKYVCRIVVNIFQERPTNKYHSTYLIKIPWQPNLIDNFNTARQKIMTISSHADNLMHLTSQLSQLIPFSHYEGLGMICNILDVKVIDDAYMDVRMEMELENARFFKTVRRCIDPTYDLWFQARKKLQYLLNDFQHDCMYIEYDDYGLVLAVHINEDYIEKDEIKWWTLTELEQVLQDHGMYMNEHFRPYFMPVLQTIVQHLSRYDYMDTIFYE